MNKNIAILRILFLLAIASPGYAELIRNAPSLVYVGPVQNIPGSEVDIRLVKTIANVEPLATGNSLPRKTSGINLTFYWCRDDGTACTGPDGVVTPEQNILARYSLCPSTYIWAEAIECLHSQISSGVYTIKVPAKVHSSYRRGRVCLRYAYDVENTSSVFANSDNTCYLTPNEIDWCSMVTPTVNYEFGTLVSSKAQGTVQEKDFSVYCSGPASYKLALAGLNGSSIPLDNGMNVDLSLDGGALDQTISSPSEGVTIHKLTATLNGIPNITGMFNATTVIYITYP